MKIFEDEKYCQDGKERCCFLNPSNTNECTKFDDWLIHYGMYKKCPQCIKESKKSYPELFI